MKNRFQMWNLKSEECTLSPSVTCIAMFWCSSKEDSTCQPRSQLSSFTLPKVEAAEGALAYRIAYLKFCEKFYELSNKRSLLEEI